MLIQALQNFWNSQCITTLRVLHKPLKWFVYFYSLSMYLSATNHLDPRVATAYTLLEWKQRKISKYWQRWSQQQPLMRQSEWGCQEKQPNKKLNLRTVNADVAVYTHGQVQSERKWMLKKVTTLSQNICCFPILFCQIFVSWISEF